MPPPAVSLSILVLVLTSCGNGSPEEDERSLRVGATWGLAPLELSINASGTSASLQPLIYVPLTQYVAEAKQSGTAVELTLRNDSSETAESLASAFRLRSLQTSRALDEQTIRMTFDEGPAASRVASLQFGGFALGPFRVRSETDSSAILERKHSHPFQTISVNEMTSQEEWRRFLGGQLDIIPRASSSHRKHLEAMESVNLIDYPASHDLGLYFNLRSERFESIAQRKFITDLVDRAALESIVSGITAPAATTAASRPQDIPAPSPSPLALVYLRADSDSRTTAAVLRYQLAEAGIDLELSPLSIDDLVAATIDGSFDLTLIPVPLGERRYTRFLSSQHAMASNITGYSSEDYDDAFAAGNASAMDHILERDVPILLLFRQRYFAAMRAGLCTSGDLDPIEWQWLASVHPCAAGESP